MFCTSWRDPTIPCRGYESPFQYIPDRFKGKTSLCCRRVRCMLKLGRFFHGTFVRIQRAFMWYFLAHHLKNHFTGYQLFRLHSIVKLVKYGNIMTWQFLELKWVFLTIGPLNFNLSLLPLFAHQFWWEIAKTLERWFPEIVVLRLLCATTFSANIWQAFSMSKFLEGLFNYFFIER